MIERTKRIDSEISEDEMFQVRPERTLFESGNVVASVMVVVSADLFSDKGNGVIQAFIQANAYVGRQAHIEIANFRLPILSRQAKQFTVENSTPLILPNL